MSAIVVEWQGATPESVAAALGALRAGEDARLVRQFAARYEGRGVSLFAGTLAGVEASVKDVPLSRLGTWEAQSVGEEPPAASPLHLLTVLVQRSYPTPTDRDDQRRRRERAAFCLDLHQVTPRSSFIRHDGLRQLCIFEAPDVEAVRIVNRKTREPFDDVWSAFAL